MANAGKEFFRKRYEQLGWKLKQIKLPTTIRINTLKTKAKDIIPRLEKLGVSLEKLPTKNGYKVESKFSLGAITEYLLGYYYIQSEAAQYPVEVLNPKSNDVILDCCAAPGGKTTQIAAQIHNEGTIISYELKPHRVRSLLSNLERCGVKNTTVFQGDMIKAEKLGIKFDKILLDAPCSGNFAQDKNWFEKRDMNGINMSSKIQKKLLKHAIHMLKKDGVLVYSTCSLEPEENELNVQWALEHLPVRLEKVTLPVGQNGLTEIFGQKLDKEISKCKRFWPENTEGFFIAKMVKK
jgi:NOL1/NOP2/sun family putative RNA methylase